MRFNYFRKMAPWLTILCVALTSQSFAEDCKSVKSQYEGNTFRLQHNLRFEEDEAIWTNFIERGDFIEVGTSVTVTKVKSEKIELFINGRDLWIMLDLEDASPSCSAILEHLLGSTSPSLDGLSKIDLKGINEGKVLIGMTRRAVFLAVGYPPYSYTPPFRSTPTRNRDLKADELVFMKGMWDVLTVKFENDTVVAIED